VTGHGARGGASGFVLKDTRPEDLLAAIRIVATGDALLAPAVTRRLIAEFARHPQPLSAVTAPPAARAALATIASLHQTVSAVIGLLRGRLAVGMVTGCTVTPLFDALATFHQAHPGVEILLLEGASDQLVHQVRAGHLDLALVGCATTPDGLETLTITQDRLVAAVQPGHPSPGGRDLPCTTSPPTPSCACRREPDCAQCSTRDLRLLLAEPGELADPAQQFLAIGRRRPHRGRVTAVLIDDELAELLHPLGHRAGKSVQRGLP
jgi:hypothetical protein